MEKLKIILLLLCLLVTATTVLAQSTLTVEIVLNQPTAKQGDIITADVYVRNAVNMGGADIGMTVDDKCLKIIDRQQGSFLPSSTDGGFSPFSELHDHDTRLSVAITDRTKYANGDGIFFETHLEVTCAQGTAPLRVSYALLNAYKDPSAVVIDVVPYSLTEHTVTAINTQLIISPQSSSVTAAPTQTLEATVTAPSTPEIAPIAPVNEGRTQNQVMLVIAVVVMVLAVIGILVLMVVFTRRRRKDDD